MPGCLSPWPPSGRHPGELPPDLADREPPTPRPQAPPPRRQGSEPVAQARIGSASSAVALRDSLTPARGRQRIPARGQCTQGVSLGSGRAPRGAALSRLGSLAQERRLVLGRGVVGVHHRGADVRVTHPRLDACDGSARRCRHRVEGVAKVVKADALEPRPGQRRVEARAEFHVVLRLALPVGEHEVVVGVKRSRLRRAANAVATLGAIGTLRTLPDFGGFISLAAWS